MKKVYVLEGSFMDHKAAYVESIDEMLEASPQLMREVQIILSAPPQFPSLIAYAPRKRRYNRRQSKPFK